MSGCRHVRSELDWVASYPKSGNTWMRFLLKSYHGGPLMDHMDSILYWSQAVCAVPVDRLMPWHEVQIRGAALFHLAAAAKNGQALVKTHNANWTVHGVPLFAASWVRRAIYLVRDPRDIAVSMAHHWGKDAAEVVELMGRKEARIQDTEKMNHFLGTWSQHVYSWITCTQFPVLVVRYEELYADAEKELRQVVEFLDWPVDDARLSAAVEANRFDKLQAGERRHGFREASEFGPFFRRGIVGAWQDELAPELAERIEQEHGDMMARLGYSKRLVPA